jgi:hypothetical protein
LIRDSNHGSAHYSWLSFKSGFIPQVSTASGFYLAHNARRQDSSLKHRRRRSLNLKDRLETYAQAEDLRAPSAGMPEHPASLSQIVTATETFILTYAATAWRIA